MSTCDRLRPNSWANDKELSELFHVTLDLAINSPQLLRENSMDSPYIQIQTTLSNKEDAVRLAKEVVNLRLAACVQIQTCTSLYRWQGNVEQDEEYLLAMKSRKDLYPELEQCILNLHPYDEPEIIALPIITGSPTYIQWMNQELRAQKNIS